MSRPEDDVQDAVAAYLAAYVAAVEGGEEPPSLDELHDAARAQATELLGLLSGGDAAVGEVSEVVGVAGSATSGTDVDGRPRAESDFALAHGFVRPAPDVVVVGPAVRRARTAAGTALADVAAAMSRRGSEVDGATLDEIERSPTHRMPPRDARLLAAVLDLPLAAIEATAEPWPADRAGLDTVRELGVHAVALEGTAVVRTARGDYLGLLRCSGDAAMLDSRTYRQAAAERLTGPWSHLAGVLLVTEQPPHRALAVDALDCVTRAHAPTGLSGFSRLGQPEPLAEAVASYDRTYAVHWSDPDPLEALDPDAPAADGQAGSAEPTPEESPGRRLPGAGSATDVARRITTLAERLDHEGRRARQTGKRPGYEAAARWLATTTPHDLADLLDELADLSPDEAQERLGEVVSP
jgi:hypothetical protein